MTKFRTILLATLGAVILLSLSSAIANAQQFPSDVVNRYSNKPCSNAYISWALWSRSEGFSFGSSGTSADCNPNNYGSWRTAAQLLARLDTYHFEKKMNANGISLLGGFQGKNGDGYLVFKKGTAMLGMNRQDTC